MYEETDIIVQRPFQAVTIKPKEPRGKPRRAFKLNVDRYVMGGHEYHLLLIPYTHTEALGARRSRTKSIAPMLPKEPGVEGVDYNARPQRMEWPKNGHLQFVRKERVEVAKEEAAWAG